MDTGLAHELGSFTFFGFSKSPEKLQGWSERLGITLRLINFGDWGHFFFFTSYGDVEETEEVIALKLGFVRSAAGSPFSTRQLVNQRAIAPDTINHSAFRGNAFIVCFGKKQAGFSAYQTLLSAYQLHYSVSGEEILCSDSLRCLVAALDHIELNEEVIPWHLALLYLPGRHTFFRNVHRLFPGEFLRWQDGNLDVRIAQDLRFADNGLKFDHADDRTTAVVYERLGAVVGAYINDIEKSDRGGLGTLLSGGTDSSLLQLIINEKYSRTPRSFSYAPTNAPNFEFEIEYARQASDIFGTEHTFVEITPEDFAELLIRATDILAHPVITDPEPNKLGLAEYLARNIDDLRFFSNGLAAGALFGGEQVRKLRILEMLGKVPASKHALTLMGTLLRPLTPRAQTMQKAADLLSRPLDLDSVANPVNTTATSFGLNSLPPRFYGGSEALMKAFQSRSKLEAQYLDSPYLIEKTQVVALLTHIYEVQVQSQRLFLSQNRYQIYPFLDEDIIRLAFAFHPQVRYVTHLTYKYAFKKILTEKSSFRVDKRRKGISYVLQDLLTWMQSGPLQEMVRDIQLPGFLSKKDFESLVEHPSIYLWSLLTFDIFRKRIVRR